jgi:hypothetical protein
MTARAFSASESDFFMWDVPVAKLGI